MVAENDTGSGLNSTRVDSHTRQIDDLTLASLRWGVEITTLRAREPRDYFDRMRESIAGGQF